MYKDQYGNTSTGLLYNLLTLEGNPNAPLPGGKKAAKVISITLTAFGVITSIACLIFM